MKTAWVLKGKITLQLSCWCINEGLPPRDLPNDLIHVLWEDGVFLWHLKITRKSSFILNRLKKYSSLLPQASIQSYFTLNNDQTLTEMTTSQCAWSHF